MKDKDITKEIKREKFDLEKPQKRCGWNQRDLEYSIIQAILKFESGEDKKIPRTIYFHPTHELQIPVNIFPLPFTSTTNGTKNHLILRTSDGIPDNSFVLSSEFPKE